MSPMTYPSSSFQSDFSLPPARKVIASLMRTKCSKNFDATSCALVGSNSVVIEPGDLTIFVDPAMFCQF